MTWPVDDLTRVQRERSAAAGLSASAVALRRTLEPAGNTAIRDIRRRRPFRAL